MGSRYRSPKQLQKKEEARNLLRANPSLDNYELASKAGISPYQAEAVRRELAGKGLFKQIPKPEFRPTPQQASLRPPLQQQASPVARRSIDQVLPDVFGGFYAPVTRRPEPPKPKDLLEQIDDMEMHDLERKLFRLKAQGMIDEINHGASGNSVKETRSEGSNQDTRPAPKPKVLSEQPKRNEISPWLVAWAMSLRPRPPPPRPLVNSKAHFDDLLIQIRAIVNYKRMQEGLPPVWYP